jgi:heterodisulfide reductase subunit A
VGLTAPRDIQKLAGKLGLELNQYRFCQTDPLSPITTNREGIFTCGAFSGPKDIPETVMQASAAAAGAEELLYGVRNTQIIPKVLPEETDIRDQGPRIGVFVCHCGINIGGVVDVPAVVSYAQGLDNVVYATESIYTCSQDSQEAIKEAIGEYRLNRVVVASCTPRTHEALFQETIREAGLNAYLFEMANIRDQDSWVHKEQPQEATEKAKDLVRMAIAKARFLVPLEKHSIDVNRDALVVGGGVGGMNAALSLAAQEFQVHLVERETHLGGNARHIHTLLDGTDIQSYLQDLIEQVTHHPHITVHTSTEIQKIDGFVGNFVTTLSNGNEQQVEHGAVVVATGGNEVREELYQLGRNPQVITQRDLESKMAAGGIKPHVKEVVMIQCAGSRDENRPYCSRYCCQEALKNAIKLKETKPDTTIYILYRDIRSYGFSESYFTRARELGIIFIRYEKDRKPDVKEIGGKVVVSVEDPVLQREVVFEPDWLVLSVAVAPQEDNETYGKMLKVPLNADGFFLEAHMKLRPVDFATEGVFLCGLAHAPKTLPETIAQAKAAASRAATILCKEQIEVEGKVSHVNEARCVACGVCESVCPYNAVKVNEERNLAEVNAALCKGCGICSASCRSGAIDVKGFTDRQILAALEEVVG